MNLADRIRSVRKAKGMTQEELARRAGVGLNLVNRIERGVVTDPHYSTLANLAGALDMSIGTLTAEPAVPLADASQAGQSGQEWAREQGARLHGMPNAEWNTHVRALDSVGIEEEYRAIVEEAKRLHAAYAADKRKRPEEKDRRAALSRDLGELRTFRVAELAAAAKLRKADELFREITQAMEDERVPF